MGGNAVVGPRLDGTLPDVSEGKSAGVRITKKRALHVNIRDESGNEVGTATNPNAVTLYDANDNPITSTIQGADLGLDVNIVTPTIEKTVGAAKGSLVIMCGTQDGTNAQALKSDTSGRAEVNIFNSLVPTAYDYISLSYTGDNLTGVVYKTGGAAGTTVATLTLAYSGSQLTSVTKT